MCLNQKSKIADANVGKNPPEMKARSRYLQPKSPTLTPAAKWIALNCQPTRMRERKERGFERQLSGKCPRVFPPVALAPGAKPAQIPLSCRRNPRSPTLTSGKKPAPAISSQNPDIDSRCEMNYLQLPTS